MSDHKTEAERATERARHEKRIADAEERRELERQWSQPAEEPVRERVKAKRLRGGTEP